MNNYQKQIEAILDIGVKLSTITLKDENEVIELIYEHARIVIDVDNMYIALYNQHSNRITFPLAFKDGQRMNIPSREISWGRTDEIIKTKKPIYIRTKREAHDWYSQPGRVEFISDPLASWLGVPMIANDEVLGVIATYSPTKDNYFDENYLKLIQIFSNYAAIAIKNSLLNRQLSKFEKEEDEYRKDIESQLEKGIEYLEISTFQKKQNTVFIAYAKEDLEIADKIYHEFIEKGYEPWLDIKKLSPGTKWKDEILEAIRSSKYFIILLSKFSVNKKGFIQKELKEGLEVSDLHPDSKIYLGSVDIWRNPHNLSRLISTTGRIGYGQRKFI